jgi:integrating conjugative element protein (TIGR03765 family)
MPVSNAANTANAVVIHDNGEAVPASQYLSHLFTTDMDNPASQPSGAQMIAFPVHSANMQPGLYAGSSSIKQAAWLAQPLFLLGNDVQSRAWLAANLPRLRELDAAGIVVNVETYADFRTLQVLADGLPLAPASADGLALSLPVKVYPILIGRNGEISQ